MSLRTRLQPLPLLRTAAGRAFERSARRGGAAIGLVLMYHEIAPKPGAPGEVLPAIGADLFRDQLAHLERHYEVVPLRELLTRAEARGNGGRIPVAISFDDDFSNHLAVAAPILADFGFAATFFLCGNTLEGPSPFWWEDLQVILDRGPGAWEWLRAELSQVFSWASLEGRVSDLTNTIEAAPPQLRDAIAVRLRELAAPDLLDEGLSPEGVRSLADGGFEIGFHTRRHYRLETLSGKDLDAAMSDGLDDLARIAGYRPDSIAYPHAKADLRVAEAALRAGFERGYLVGDTPTTSEQHSLLLARVGGATDSLATFKWVLGRATRQG